jgi:hypothetical protein
MLTPKSSGIAGSFFRLYGKHMDSPTSERYGYVREKQHGRFSWIERINSSHKIVQIIELSLGLFLAYYYIRTLNLVLFSFSISLVLGYLVLRYGWENRILKPFLYMPLTIIMIGMIFLGMNMIGAQGLFLTIFMIHF